MDLSKLSTEDLVALKSGDLSKVSTDGLMELKRLNAPKSIAEQNLESLNNNGPLDDLKGLFHDGGNLVKAGYSGIADLVSGNGTDQAKQDVENVTNDKEPETTAGKVGETAGSFFTPGQIAAQAAAGPVIEGIGAGLSSLMQGWGAKAAANAVGKIKKLGETLGVKNIESLGQFLMKPIRVGSQTFEPIVQATSTPEEMLTAAEAARDAAGKQLQAIGGQADKAVAGAGEQGGVSYVIDLPKLQADVQALKDEYEAVAPNLSAAVLSQYKNALADVEKNISKVTAGNTDTVFSDFSRLKTILGKLIYKHGSPLESKAALNDVYHLISDTLDQGAKNVGGDIGAAYDHANDVYHKLSAVVQGLEGKTADAAKLFDVPAMLAAMSSGFSTMAAGHPMLSALAAPAGYIAARTAETYAPQAVATGLTGAAIPAGNIVKAGLRAIPRAAAAVSDALSPRDNEQ